MKTKGQSNIKTRRNAYNTLRGNGRSHSKEQPRHVSSRFSPIERTAIKRESPKRKGWGFLCV